MDLLLCLAQICWQEGDETRAIQLVKRALTSDGGGMSPLEAAEGWQDRVYALLVGLADRNYRPTCFFKTKPFLSRLTIGSEGGHLN